MACAKGTAGSCQLGSTPFGRFLMTSQHVCASRWVKALVGLSQLNAAAHPCLQTCLTHHANSSPRTFCFAGLGPYSCMVWASNAAADSICRGHDSRCWSRFLQAYRVRDDRVRSRLWWRQNVRTVTCAPDTPLVRSYGTHVGSEKLCNSHTAHTCTLQAECCLLGR